MMERTNKNFKWLISDISSSLSIRLLYTVANDGFMYGNYEPVNVLEVTMDELDIENANIDDLTNLLTFGIVRFVNINDSQDLVDIPLRNLYKLYENGNKISLDDPESFIGNNGIKSKELDSFSIIDGKLDNSKFTIVPYIICEPTNDLKMVFLKSKEFCSLGMQDKFKAMSDVNFVNRKRVLNDERNV